MPLKTSDFAVEPTVGETLVELHLECEPFHLRWARDSVSRFGVELARYLEQEFDGAEVWATRTNGTEINYPRPWHFNREEQDALLAACKGMTEPSRRSPGDGRPPEGPDLREYPELLEYL